MLQLAFVNFKKDSYLSVEGKPKNNVFILFKAEKSVRSGKTILHPLRQACWLPEIL